MALTQRLAALAVLASVLAPAAPPGALVAAAPPEASIEALLPSWSRRAEWALERFELAGLPLPPLSVRIHRSERPCGGNSGLYRPGPPVEVNVCSTGDAGTASARLVTLHELAHAWAETQLSPTQRQQFLELRGLGAWTDPNVPRHEWGAEHAAEVISWGLMDEEVSIIRVDGADPASLGTAFEQLAGRRPLWADRSAAQQR